VTRLIVCKQPTFFDVSRELDVLCHCAHTIVLCCLQHLSSRIEPNLMSELCSLGQTNHSFQGYPISIEPINSRGEARYSGLVEKKTL
jgi:hypothetical protein